ncbi:MAG: hypothetical protein ACREV4_03800 [Gammaproteobacteria bacterium]
MCPACLTSMALAVIGGTSAGGLTALDISKDTLDMAIQPAGRTVPLSHNEPGITEATRPDLV